ncbi:hypothetical protein AB0J83_20540 [Actinoplanes sp. NPDC049596]|uniref:hypothetical protein n=1 Tax=Actinoplanes sp. NPDC049596 TaxID=3154625 RepID=UPI0034364021
MRRGGALPTVERPAATSTYGSDHDHPVRPDREGSRLHPHQHRRHRRRAWQLPNDARLRRYIGAAPPAGSGRRNYYIAIHALDVTTIGIVKDSTPAFLSVNLTTHTQARVVITRHFSA